MRAVPVYVCLRAPISFHLQLCNHPKLLVEGNATAITAEVASFLPKPPVGASGSGGGFGYGRRGGGGVQKGVFPEWSGCVRTEGFGGVSGPGVGGKGGGHKIVDLTPNA